MASATLSSSRAPALTHYTITKAHNTRTRAGPITLDLDGVSDSVLVKGPGAVMRFIGLNFRGARKTHSK